MSSSIYQSRALSYGRAFSMLIIGVSILVAVMGCASTKDRERRALSDEFDKWLGRYKDHRIIERGLPDRCIAQSGGSEICEWQSDAGTVRFLYDKDSIARRWKYADPRMGEMKGAQEPPTGADQLHESEAAVWKTIKDTFDDMKFTPIGAQ